MEKEDNEIEENSASRWRNWGKTTLITMWKYVKHWRNFWLKNVKHWQKGLYMFVSLFVRICTNMILFRRCFAGDAYRAVAIFPGINISKQEERGHVDENAQAPYSDRQSSPLPAFFLSLTPSVCMLVRVCDTNGFCPIRFLPFSCWRKKSWSSFSLSAEKDFCPQKLKMPKAAANFFVLTLDLHIGSAYWKETLLFESRRRRLGGLSMRENVIEQKWDFLILAITPYLYD
jgi:hypothetical protein